VIEKKTTKRCPRCGIAKPLVAFHRDHTRADGRQGICRVCKSAVNRKRRLKQFPHKSANIVSENHMMTDRLFHEVFSNRELREYLNGVAVRLSRGKEDFKQDLLQEAWIKISLCPSGRSWSVYRKVGETAMKAFKWKLWARREFQLDSIEQMSRLEYEMWRHGYLPIT